MKAWSLIMCLYVCSLLCFPCQDNGVHSGVAGHMASDATHHDKDDGECHHCSPFCTCNCCHVTAITSLHIFAGVSSDVIIPTIPSTVGNISEGVRFSIWQPPKA